MSEEIKETEVAKEVTPAAEAPTETPATEAPATETPYRNRSRDSYFQQHTRERY